MENYETESGSVRLIGRGKSFEIKGVYSGTGVLADRDIDDLGVVLERYQDEKKRREQERLYKQGIWSLHKTGVSTAHLELHGSMTESGLGYRWHTDSELKDLLELLKRRYE